MIEPALLACPICVGPRVWNFQAVADELIGVCGARQVHSADAIVEVISSWMNDPAAARTIGGKAREYMRSQQGATEKTWAAIENLL